MERGRIILASLVAVVWIGIVCFGFWHYSLRYQHSSADYWATFDGTKVATIAPTGRMTMVHWVDPDCPCSRFSGPHIKQLQLQYSGVVHQIVKAESDPAELSAELLGSFYTVPATPAVAVYNERGELAYFGPYSSGAICGSGKDLVANVLTQLRSGVNPVWINQEAIGCMCRWPSFKKVNLESSV